MAQTQSWQLTTLSRPQDDRLVAGVCAGIARRFGLSSVTVRLLFVLSILLPGPQLVIYLVLWVLMPEAPRVPAAPRTPAGP